MIKYKPLCTYFLLLLSARGLKQAVCTCTHSCASSSYVPMAADSLSDVTLITNKATIDSPNDTPSRCTSVELGRTVETPGSFILPGTCGDKFTKKTVPFLSSFPSSAVLFKQPTTFPNEGTPSGVVAGSTAIDEGTGSLSLTVPKSVIVNDIKFDTFGCKGDQTNTKQTSVSTSGAVHIHKCSDLETEMLYEASVEHELLSTKKTCDPSGLSEKQSLKDTVSNSPDDVCNNDPPLFLAMDVEGLLASVRHGCNSIDGNEYTVSTTNSDKNEHVKNSPNKKRKKSLRKGHTSTQSGLEKQKWKNSMLPSSKHRSVSEDAPTDKDHSEVNSKLNRFPGDTTTRCTSSKTTSRDITDIGEIPMVDSSQILAEGRVATTQSNMAECNGAVPKPRRVSPNAFVSIRIPSVEIRHNIEAVQRGLVGYDDNLSNSLTSLDKLHLTLCVLRLDSDSEIERAKTVLSEATEKVITEFDLQSKPLEINFKGLGSFSQNVVFAQVEEGPSKDRLRAIASSVRSVFETHKFIGMDKREFKAHLTIAKMSKMPPRRNKYRGRKEAPGRRGIDRLSYRQFLNNEFGSQVINGLELLSMIEPKAADGYYHCFSKVDFQL